MTVLSTVSNISTLNILKLPKIAGVPSISHVVTLAPFLYGNYYTKWIFGDIKWWTETYRIIYFVMAIICDSGNRWYCDTFVRSGVT